MAADCTNIVLLCLVSGVVSKAKCAAAHSMQNIFSVFKMCYNAVTMGVNRLHVIQVLVYRIFEILGRKTV